MRERGTGADEEAIRGEKCEKLLRERWDGDAGLEARTGAVFFWPRPGL